MMDGTEHGSIAADADKARIRELIERWVILRDMGSWDLLRGVWHSDGLMAASWREGTADEFVAANKASWNTGLDILHQLGGSMVEISACGQRAVSMTKMVISQRAPIHGIACDVTAQARHYDLWEKRDGAWGLLERRTVFDRDRLDTVRPGDVVELDAALLAAYPSNYCHLAYLQRSLGFPVRTDLPHLRGDAAVALYQYGDAWLRSGERQTP